MYCKYLKKRKDKPFCKVLNNEIDLSMCQFCSNKEYKNAQYCKNTVQKLKKQTKKHKKLESERFSIITNDLKHCFVCGKPKNALHEVFYGSYRLVSIRLGMVIPLCSFHHTEGKYSVHFNRDLDLQLKKMAQTIFEKKYSHDLFMKEFKIDYKEKYKED